MQSKEGLLPAAEVLSGLDGPVKAIREASPRRCTTTPASTK